MTVLDLGCGSGGLAKYLAENYQVKVVGYNISKEQCEYAEKLCKGLPVTIVLDDYRNATGEFDRVFSVGLVEHLGHKNYRTYFEVVDRCLKPDGIHVFESMVRFDEQMPDHDKFLDTYVLPHSQLPLLTQFLHAMEDLFILEDLQNIGYDYHKTLVAWHENFQKAWPKFEAKYGQKFYRMFSIFLCSMGGFFKARKIQCCQIVLTKTKLARTYER
ncbi:unnamed protein product [Cyprideis torosa]|uniref:Uncharacterized protein n=1 Tax=Cyprideis torosa TaxID=163714 RepID=A0A7R8ZWS5_9CRUS|nr:unnamed protein product [Cyprideis torosa]CAG0905858.1 unnamed protein product [Cyprideis torosa]